MTSTHDAARDRMLNELKDGAAACKGGDASSLTVLIRGCDPVMAERASSFLPKLIGNAQIEGATDDNVFISKLQGRKYDAVVFAPGACRWNKAKKPIPGGTEATKGWSLEEYRNLVRQHQGPEIAIVETTEESEMVPLIRQALKLP